MRIMPKRLARKEANSIVSAAIHGAIHEGLVNRYNAPSAERIQDELVKILDYYDSHAASMDEVEPYEAR